MYPYPLTKCTSSFQPGQFVHTRIAFLYMCMERHVCIKEKIQESRDPVTIGVSSLGWESFLVWELVLTYTYPSREHCDGNLLINI